MKCPRIPNRTSLLLLGIGLLIGVLVYEAYAVSDSGLGDQQKLDIVYGMYEDYKRAFPKVHDITPKQAMALSEKGGVVFVDTRKSKEMKISTLPGAVSKKDFLKNPEKYAEKTIVAYCTISYRSGKWAQKLARNGVQIYNLTGGILAWVLEGGKVYDADGETKKIHVYGRKWNYPATGYESVW